MSDTPKTDAVPDAAWTAHEDVCTAYRDLCRQLETENETLRAALSAYVNADDWTKALEDQAIAALANNKMTDAAQPRSV